MCVQKITLSELYQSFKKAKLEEALSTLSYKTFVQVKDLRDNESNDKENLA